MNRYEVTLRPVNSGSPMRIRYLHAATLAEAQDRAHDRWPMHSVFEVRALPGEYEATQAGAQLSDDDEIIDPWDSYPGGMSDREPDDDEVMNPNVQVPFTDGYPLDDPKHPDW